MRYVRHQTRAASASTGSVDAERLYGIDSGEGSASRAARVINMIKTDSGAVAKRPGYRIAAAVGASSVHIYRSYEGDIVMYAVGTMLKWQKNGVDKEYDAGFDLSGCRSLQWDTYMFFFNGDGLIIADMKMSSFSHWSIAGCGGNYKEAYLPTIYIACTPDGAGSAYEPVNLLSERVAEQFQGDGMSTMFNVHLDGDDFEAYIKEEDGSWKKTEINTFSHRSVELVSAPPAPDITGEDNVRIEYSLPNFFNNAIQPACCTCGASFGVDGHRDRVFLSGNRSRPGRVYYSHMDKPLYFADLDYIKVGDSETDVYALIRDGDSLAVVTDDSIYSVKGVSGEQLAVVHDAFFTVNDIYATPEPIGSAPPVFFMGEPVYITREGVCAITPSGVMDERCADIRSEQINADLKKEDMSMLEMTVCGDLLVLSNRKDRLYLLDGRHYVSSGSSRRYEGYIWEDICATSLWTDGDKLYFCDGTNVYCFEEGVWSDEREAGKLSPISCLWETPRLYPADFRDFKFFTRVGVLLECDTNTDVKILARLDEEEWQTVRDYNGELSVMCYGSIDYGSFSFCPRIKSRSVTARLSGKRGKGISLRFESDKLDRPLSLIRFGAEYIKM